MQNLGWGRDGREDSGNKGIFKQVGLRASELGA